MDKLQPHLDKFGGYLNTCPVLVKAEDDSGVKKEYLTLGGAALVFLILITGFGASFLCNLTGFLYPSYASFKAIETSGKTEDSQWLTYWVVFAFINILETLTSLFVAWIPFYYAIKFGFYFWLFLPQTKGAAFLYTTVLCPFLKNHESRIDKTMKKVMKNSGSVIADATALAADASVAAAKVIGSKKE